jgi:hypothetical protein
MIEQQVCDRVKVDTNMPVEILEFVLLKKLLCDEVKRNESGRVDLQCRHLETKLAKVMD